jgi:threonine synthase
MNGCGLAFSSANSINIGRLVPQVVYYVYAYSRLLKEGEIQPGEKINISVPTGNFGNILAAHYAKEMGVPIQTLICASNENKVLFDFFRTGCYDKNRPFILTSSPSMDILISSNLERLIYEISGKDTQKTAEFMSLLSKEGRYQITEEMQAKLQDFYGGYSSEKECFAEISHTFDTCGYVMDTHTAVAGAVYEAYRRETGDETKTLVVSTASPYKFAPSILRALEPDVAGKIHADQIEDAFACVDELARISGVKIPGAVDELRQAPVLHNKVSSVEGMEATVREILKM